MRWTNKERIDFHKGVYLHERNYTLIQKEVKTKTVFEIRQRAEKIGSSIRNNTKHKDADLLPIFGKCGKIPETWTNYEH